MVCPYLAESNWEEEHSGERGTPPPGLSLFICETSSLYQPRNPAESILYGVVAGHLESFLDRQRKRDRTVPRFVERELRSFLDCGILANGFLRVHCDACRQDRIVPFSCKCRGFCPSCGGRRMADTAAHLVDRVFPEVPVRQWVLSLPFALRYRLAYDASLVRDVLKIFVQAIFASLRRGAGIPASDRQARCGAVSFVQRFGDALNLNVHFHTLVLAGVYVAEEEDRIVFRPVPPPSDAEVVRVTQRIIRRIEKLLERRGLGPQANTEESDSLLQKQPLLAELYSASIAGRVATGPRAGHRITKVGDEIDVEYLPGTTGPRCACISGFSVHANVCMPAHDRMRLERLCRYTCRPPVATERLSLLPDGRLLYRLKRRWRDGTSHVIFEPLEMVEKLAALVPPPKFNLVRYHGVFAAASAWRPLIVPESAVSDSADAAGPAHANCPESKPPSEPASYPPKKRKKSGCRPRNYSWAELMRRVWDIDVLECARCKGRMRILCAIHPPDAIRKILDCLGLPTRPPPLAPAKPAEGSLYLS